MTWLCEMYKEWPTLHDMGKIFFWTFLTKFDWDAVIHTDFFEYFSDPSIEGDIPFKSCQSSDEIYCHEVSNEPKTRITTNIKKQLNYDMWREIDDIYKNLNIKWCHVNAKDLDDKSVFKNKLGNKAKIKISY